MPKEEKKQEGNNKSYRDDYHPKQVYQLNDGATSMQVTLMVKLPTPIASQTGQRGSQDIQSDNKTS